MKLTDYALETVTKSISMAEMVSDGQNMPNWHWHPHYEMMLIKSGIYTLENNGRKVSSDKPIIFISMPYSLHNLNAKPGTKYHRFIINFTKDTLGQLPVNLLTSSGLMNATSLYAFPTQAELDELCYMILKLRRYLTNPDKDMVMSKLYIALIIRRISIMIERGRGEIVSSSVSYISEVLRYISETISEPQTVENLSKRYGVGESKFYSDFKANTGMTYKKYLTTLRQTKARELLESGSSVINASLEVGYSSEAHFIKAFRKYWGTTPGQILKQDQ